jgi:hypothetical protein
LYGVFIESKYADETSLKKMNHKKNNPQRVKGNLSREAEYSVDLEDDDEEVKNCFTTPCAIL